MLRVEHLKQAGLRGSDTFPFVVREEYTVTCFEGSAGDMIKLAIIMHHTVNAGFGVNWLSFSLSEYRLAL